MRLRKLRQLDLPTLRAAWWALRAVRHVRRRLGKGGLDAIDVPGVPRLPPGAERGMHPSSRAGARPASCARPFARHGTRRTARAATW